jgi:phosphoglycerate dehydrogenase-like enzyme
VLTVLSHVGDGTRFGLDPELAGQVEVVAIPAEGDLPEGLTGQVLISRPTLVPNFAEVVARGVEWVHLIGTGIDEFPLDLVGPGLVLTNSRGMSAVPISEWVLACMLAFEKRLPAAWIDRPPSLWNFPAEPLGTLHGRRVGLLGLGGIGTAVAERLLPFGAEVRAVRASNRPSPVAGVEVVPDVATLAAGADHLVVVAPLTAATRGILDDAVLASMAPGSHLVNVARGPIVDEAALRRALDRGPLAAASIDAPDPEPLPEGHWMYTHPGVRLSAHVSWNWPGAGAGLFEAFRENLARFLVGEPLENVIDPALGY